MQRDISPEERLLALIKKKPKKPQDEALAKPDSKEIEKPEARLGIFKVGLFKNKIFEPKALKSINKYMAIGLVLLAAYFIFDLLFIKPYKNIQSLISQAPAPRTLAQTKKEVPLEVKDYSYYSKEISGKKIFGAPPQEKEGSLPTGKDLDEVSKNLTLVGIVAGESPQAIIEDKKSQKTYYLNKSQSFNGFVVQEIADGRVVLEYEGRRITLFL